MTFRRIASAIVCCTALISTMQAAPAMLDKIVAIVNDDIVTQKQLDTNIQILQAQLQQAGQPMPDAKALRLQAINQLIDFTLQVQLGKTNNIKIKPAEVDQAIARIADQNKIPLAEFQNNIVQSGLDYKTYRERIQDQLIVSKVQQGALQSKMQLDKALVKQYLASHPYKSPMVYHVQDLLISVSDQPTDAELSEKNQEAKRVMASVKPDMDLSVGLNAVTQKDQAKIIDLDWRQPAELPVAFAKTVTNLKIGQLAGPIKTDNGFHILKLVGTRSQGGKTNQQLEQEAMAALYQTKLKTEMESWMKDIRAQSYIKILS